VPAQAEKCPCCGHEFHQGWEETIPEIPEEALASSSATEAPAQPLTAEDAAKHLYLRVAEVVTASRAFEQSESEETGKLFIKVNLKKEEIASIIRKVTEPLEAEIERLREELAEADFGFGGWEATKASLESENSRLKQELADERSADAATQAKVVQVDDENIRLKQELAAIRKEADAAENDLLRISKALNQPGSHVTSIADRTISELAVLRIAEENLADYAREYFNQFDMYMRAWLREMGGVIVPKRHQIDGFVLRARDIYEKAQLVDRMKAIMVAELKKKSSAEELFDAVFKMLAENGRDKVPTN
jgi:chromosome segregation ATPase